MSDDQKRKFRKEKAVIKKKGKRHRRQVLKDQLRRSPDEQTTDDYYKYGRSESVAADSPTLGSTKNHPGSSKKKRKPWERKDRK